MLEILEIITICFDRSNGARPKPITLQTGQYLNEGVCKMGFQPPHPLAGYREVVVDQFKHYGRLLLLSAFFSLSLLTTIVVCGALFYSAWTAGDSLIACLVILVFLIVCQQLVKQFTKLSGCDEDITTSETPRPTEPAATGRNQTPGGVASAADR